MLLPYHKDTISNRNPDRPPAVEVNGDYEFEVDEILDSRTYRGYVQYLVRWTGYDDSENSWEPLKNVRHATEALHNFHVAHPDAVHPISLSNSRPDTSLYRRDRPF